MKSSVAWLSFFPLKRERRIDFTSSSENWLALELLFDLELFCFCSAFLSLSSSLFLFFSSADMVFSCLIGASSKRPLSFLLGFVLDDFLSVLDRFFSLESDEDSDCVVGVLIEADELAMATEKIVEKHAKHVKKVQFQEIFLGLMEDFPIDSVVKVAQHFFPFVVSTNFSELFKLSPLQVAKHLGTNDFTTIRDFLLLLLWCRHYMPMRALGVLFNLSKSRVSQILLAETDKLYVQIRNFVNLNDLQIFEPFFLNNCVGVVDSTEVQINTWVGDSYSGKKGAHTLKYQVVCCLTTGKPVQICGPYFGKESDATIWKKSEMGEYLQDDDLWVG